MRKTLSYGKSLCLLIVLFYSSLAWSQKTPEQIKEMRSRVLSDSKVKSIEISSERQTPSLLALKAGNGSYNKVQAKPALEKLLNIRGGIDDLVADKETRASAAIEVVEYQQFYKGIKVDRAKFKAFIMNGNVVFYNGAFYEVPASLSVQPRVNKAAALERAKGTVNAKKFAWEHVQEVLSKTTNAAAKKALQNELNEYLPEGELVVIKDFTKEGVAQMRLAYKFDIYSFEPISRAYVYVDAEDGRILLRDAIIKHVNDDPSPTSSSVNVTVQTRYAGSRSIKTRQISGNDPNSGLTITPSNPTESYSPGAATYALIDDSRGNGVETYDLNGVGGLPLSIAVAYSQGKSFTDVDNNWTLTEHKRGNLLLENAESENDDYAWDAHWGAGVVYDYWKVNQNRLSFDGKDAKIKSFIHSGIGYDNAFWNGRVMTYGDGSYTNTRGTGFRPLTSLDVCAHEIGHGVCTFTADLVYAKESGAMNEGFSDIWAACAEYFAVKKVDGSLNSVYKPFYIGEQIAANPAVPLRRMDNPQARRHPDTYGGNFWRNPNCSPTLANDYCGVHTNSGVLNKWFYLMTVGSGSGSGPDAAFAGEDDGINDKGDVYTVTGLGFAVSERITYLTELMLTTTATFAEARAVSIEVASAMSGNPCSDMVKSVTNAWYAVNVGSAFTEPCKVTYGFILQPGSSVSEGTAGAGCTAEYEVKIPVVLPANSSAAITTSGTATNGVDYRLSATSLSNATSTTKVAELSVFVKNDGMIEGDESITITAAITNTGTGNVNNTYILNIIEDDVTPVIGNDAKTIFTETFPVSNGFNSPVNWTKIEEVAASINKWGVWNGKLQVTAMGYEVVPGPGYYDQNTATSTIAHSPEINALGLSNINIKFDYEVQGEVDPNGIDPEKWGTYDYMSVVYSFDGKTFFELTPQEGFGHFASAEIKSGTFEGILPSYFNNKKFYIGFRWYNDALVGTLVSVRIDNVSLAGTPRQIENDLDHNGRENLSPGQDVYFYSIQDGQLLGRVKNESTKDFGCTNLYVEKAGNGTFNLYQSNKDGLQKVADKIVRVEAASIYNASSTVSLYFTNEQLAALEQATGKSRTQFVVYHVNAANYTGSSSQNTKKYTPVYTAINGVGAYYTITNTSRVNGSYALGTTVSTLGTMTVSAQVRPMDELVKGWKFHSIYPNPGNGNINLQIVSPESKRVSIEVVNQYGQLLQVQQMSINAGSTTLPVNMRSASTGTYLIRIKDTDGQTLNVQTYIKN